MATKKPKKKAAKKAAPRKQVTLVNERIILALESIAGSLEKLATPLMTVTGPAHDCSTHQGLCEKQLVEAGIAPTPTDAELLS